jgi:hypothetical protein
MRSHGLPTAAKAMSPGCGAPLTSGNSAWATGASAFAMITPPERWRCCVFCRGGRHTAKAKLSTPYGVRCGKSHPRDMSNANNILPFPLPHQGEPDPRRMALASIGVQWRAGLWRRGRVVLSDADIDASVRKCGSRTQLRRKSWRSCILRRLP